MGKSLGSPKMCHLARMIHSTKARTFGGSGGRGEGLWLMWTDEVQVMVHSYSHHIILAVVIIRSTDLHLDLVCIYGDSYHRNTSQIWNQVASFVYDNANMRIICIGDMNELLYDMDKNSLNINRTHMNAFRLLIKNYGLFDLGFSSPAYTWTNKRFSSKPIYKRLDRCLVNAKWCTICPVSNQHAKNIWNTKTNCSFSTRTNHLAGALKIWCRKKKPIQEEINNAELAEKYEQNMVKLTDFYLQRAKKSWIKDGDRNTSFFHKAIKKGEEETLLSR
uniref:Uncharacterized protein n=1 Tax=Avena sativa TaxID=4498 RepID=A0ACD5V108_AVESA